MPLLTLERLQLILSACSRQSIALVGDLFLDRYLEIQPGVEEYSVETGLEAYQVSRVRNLPGALGTVMNNLAALGVGRLVPVTLIGDDGHAYDLLHELGRLPVETSHIVRCADRLTPTYTKPLKQDASGQWQELHRLDVRTRGPLSERACGQVCEQVREAWEGSDGLIVLDQVGEENWGVVNSAVRGVLEQLSREQPQKLLYIDSRAHLGRFGCGVLKGNRSELLAAAGLPVEGGDVQGVEQAGRALARRTGQSVYCTLGEQGTLVVRPGQAGVRVPGYRVSGAVDIVGAGDSATSGMVVSLLAGADPLEAAAVGNLVASITVKQLGTTGTASPQQVLQRWHEVGQ